MTPWKRVGNYLGMSMAQSNPRKAIKRADKPLGNLPLEILTYLSCYIEEALENGTLKSPVVCGQVSKSFPYPFPFFFFFFARMCRQKCREFRMVADVGYSELARSAH
jgi:hypothetical protein